MTDTATMAAFGASDRACYDYPDDTDVAKAQRAAFCAGAAWSADEIDRLLALLKQTLCLNMSNEFRAEIKRTLGDAPR
jgi:hypothetical protein